MLIYTYCFFDGKYCIFFSISYWFNILRIFLRSYTFYRLFVPSNVPGLLLPFLVVIEIISHIAKVFSLAIRLFANMMSGHVLLHILMGFFIKIARNYILISIFPMMLIVAIFFLEYGITFLQAYVFVILVSIYFEENFGFSKEDELKLKSIYKFNGSINNSFKYDFYTNSFFLKEKTIEVKNHNKNFDDFTYYS